MLNAKLCLVFFCQIIVKLYRNSFIASDNAADIYLCILSPQMEIIVYLYISHYTYILQEILSIIKRVEHKMQSNY